MSDNRPFAGWAILELLGHRRLGGYLSEQQIAGAGFIRIDVPATEKAPAFSQFYPPASVYCLTPSDEGTARAIAGGMSYEPVSRWELPRLSEPEAGTERIEDDDEADEWP